MKINETMKHILSLILILLVGASPLEAQNTFPSSGKVGIGTTSPIRKLHIVGTGDLVRLQSTTRDVAITFKNSEDPNGQIRFDGDSDGIEFRLNGTTSESAKFYVGFSGNVGIGTITPDAKLTVKGDIHAEAVNVDLNVPAPDYVFEDDYDLRSLEETEAYIKVHKHLPEVPSAQEMEAQGLDLVQMNMLLLKKIVLPVCQLLR